MILLLVCPFACSSGDNCSINRFVLFCYWYVPLLVVVETTAQLIGLHDSVISLYLLEIREVYQYSS